jgi:hypothetical protein
MRGTGIAFMALLAVSCGVSSSAEFRDADTQQDAGAASACRFPSDPTIILDDGGLVLKVWRFPLEEVHVRPVLPDDPGLLAYRAAIRDAGADEMYPALHVPGSLPENEAAAWQEENHNNRLAYEGGVGSIDPISCLDALLFAEQNRRVPQLEQPTEFLASVLRRELPEQTEVVVVFGAGTEMFPPSSVHGFDIVDEYVGAGWQYWYALHNHTIQANGALGVPVPSMSDVQFVRRLAAQRGLERVRVTNGFYSFDSAVSDIASFRAR